MPRRIDRSERRKHLVDAARRVMLDEGAHALSMAKVAQAAGLAKATVFEGFSSREELLDEVYCNTSPGFEGDMRDPIGSVMAWIRDRARAPASALRSLCLAEAARSDSRRAQRIRDELAAEESSLAEFLHSSMERGRIASLPPQRTAAQLLAALDGMIGHLAARRLPAAEAEARLNDLCRLWRSRLEQGR